MGVTIFYLPCQPLGLALLLTIRNYNLAGECPRFPYQAYSQSEILHLPT